MGKKRSGPSAAIAPSAGKKMTFDDNDDFDSFAQPSSPNIPSDAPSDADEEEDVSDSDSDAAPEAVGMRSGAADERKRAQAAEAERKQQREAAKLRAARVADAKAASKKSAKTDKRKRAMAESDSEEDEDESPEAARLRRRMEAAMAAGDDSEDEEEEDESDFDEEGEDDFDGLEDNDVEEEEEEEEDDEEEDEEEAEDEDDDDESDDEGLLSRPLPSSLKSRMDAMMAAMEGRAMASDPKFADEMAKRRAKGPVLEVPSLKKSAAKPSSGLKGTKTTFDDDGADWGVAPLPASLLAEADANLRAEKAAATATAVEHRARKRRRKASKAKKADPVSRVLDDRTVHLLPPVLGAGAALPPVVGPRERVAATNKSAKNFYTRAMRESGKIPGRGAVDGRRR